MNLFPLETHLQEKEIHKQRFDFAYHRSFLPALFTTESKRKLSLLQTLARYKMPVRVLPKTPPIRPLSRVTDTVSAVCPVVTMLLNGALGVSIAVGIGSRRKVVAGGHCSRRREGVERKGPHVRHRTVSLQRDKAAWGKRRCTRTQTTRWGKG